MPATDRLNFRLRIADTEISERVFSALKSFGVRQFLAKDGEAILTPMELSHVSVPVGVGQGSPN